MTKKEKYILYKFVKYVEKQLNITTPYKIKLSSNHKHFKTTAYYDDNTKTAAVYTKNRALVDICRSLAHELVHLMQHQNNKIHGKVKDVGGPIEDEANAVAGRLIKQFGYDYPKLRFFQH